MKTVTSIELSPEELRELISAAIEEKLRTIPTPQPSEERLLTREQAAEFLQVDLSTLHRWAQKGILSPRRIGGKVRYYYSDIQKILEGQEKE